VQWDTSEHDWLEGRGPKLYLLAMIDDATSRALARFAAQDATQENFRLLASYLTPPREVAESETPMIMRNALVFAAGLALLISLAFAWDGGVATSNVSLNAGVGSVDITPNLPVALAGSPAPKKAESVDTRLYVKALVLSTGEQKLAIVTLDTLKYPVEYVVQARRKIEQTTGIPASNVIICASHTHSGPLWTYYKDVLVTPITEAVALAARDLTPCRIGTAKGKVEGVSQNRRVLKDGTAWNRWQLSEITRFTTGIPILLSQTGDRSLCGCTYATEVDYPNYNGQPIQFFNPRSNTTHTYFSKSQFSSRTWASSVRPTVASFMDLV
jgi:hypothetical protein